MKYTVRFSTRASGWVNIATVDTMEKAIDEFDHQLKMDEHEKDTTNKTQIIDDTGKVITDYEAENY